MSVTDTSVVDMIGVVPGEGGVVLTISDHLEWEERCGEHLLILQEKINTYLRFIESGEIYVKYPKSKGKSLIIRIYFKYLPDEMGDFFLEKAEKILNDSGIELQVNMNLSDID